MINYYEILGIDQTASSTEIKSAFRTLAKLYHPDKNENGKEFFSKLLKAYETLSNNKARARYDLQLNYSKNIITTSNVNDAAKATKNWSFDEKELKRRQYYNEYFKKQMNQNEPLTDAEINKTNYNEFKYIFFAIPIAVLLFLLVVKLAQNNT